VGECKIKYGEGFQQNQNREATVSVKANTNIGYKGQYPGGLFEYEIMASLEAGIKKYLGDARSYEWGHWFEFSSKTGKFVVIATRTYYDSYLYKILDPNDLLGSDNHNDTINMNVPKASSSALPLYYEDYRAYADTIPRLPKILLPPLERPGRVVSYPRGFVYPNGYPVPTSELMLINHPIYHITREGTQGGWYIRLSEQQVNQSVLSSSANLVFGVKVLNMAFRIAGSVGAEYTHTIKAGKLLEIKADMGYIPDSLPYWHWYYEYVPYIYRAPKDSGGYYVLNFFVQNLGPGYQNQIGESKNNPLLVTEFLSPHPNPFTKTTSIQFTLAQPGNVSLKIYNPAGQLVATLLNHFEKPGRYNLLWKGIDDNGKRVASGIYYCELIAGSYHSIKKVILAR
ncbi:MAG: FlgD immunoglobulin-like domain containing protein, partial [candidate division WOR-3 bacterium]